MRLGAKNGPFSSYSVPICMPNYTAAGDNCLSGQHDVRWNVSCTPAAKYTFGAGSGRILATHCKKEYAFYMINKLIIST